MTFFKGRRWRFSRARFAEKLGQIPSRAETTQSNVFQMTSDFCNRKIQTNMTRKIPIEKRLRDAAFIQCRRGIVSKERWVTKECGTALTVCRKKKDNHTENTWSPFDLAVRRILMVLFERLENGDVRISRFTYNAVTMMTASAGGGGHLDSTGGKKNGSWKKAGFEKRTTWPLQLHT